MLAWTRGRPAVILGNADSIFPRIQASYWRSMGLDVAIVTQQRDAPASLPDGIPVVNATTLLNWKDSIARRLLNSRFARETEERMARWWRAKYESRTSGLHQEEAGQYSFRANLAMSAPMARLACSLRPAFVFGQEASAYGLATAWCRNVPRILFPWGGDIYFHAEISPVWFHMVSYALRHVDLVLPASTSGARRICERFGVDPQKVHALPWGAEIDRFPRADPRSRQVLALKWGFDPRATLVLNVRRFRKGWGCSVALSAFLRLARLIPNVHFAFLGGSGTEADTKEAQRQAADEGLTPRFTFVQGDIPLKECGELMSVADVFTSLADRGDMRSQSILQAAASGGIPVISDLPEYRQMSQEGFACLLTPPNDDVRLFETLRDCLQRTEEKRSLMHAQNLAYLTAHADRQVQMRKMLELIQGVCERYV